MIEGDVTRKIRVKQIDVVPTCLSCGKTIGRFKGTGFTNWIFRPDICLCATPLDSQTMFQASTKPMQLAAIEMPDLGARFKIEEMIGRGGMADVFKAIDNVSNSTVAIKLLRKESASDKNRVEGFEREIKASMVLDHPNLAAVLDYGTTDEGTPYSVMEFVDGRPLDEAPPGDGLFLDSSKAIDMFLQVCEGLAHAHARGIVHLDLKPSNILRCKKGEVDIAKILDFGIARIVTSDTKQELSESDEVVGSLPYMSPEQLNGENIDFRSDIYSLGCLMYEILTGHVPFNAENPVKIIMNHLDGLPNGFTTQFKRMEVPAGLEQIIRHCLERDPASRYQCIEELIRDLELVRDGGSPEVAQRQIQLQKQHLAIVTPMTKKIAMVSFALGIGAYMFYLSSFDTWRQIVMFSQVIYCCLLVAAGAKFFLFARPYLVEIEERLETPGREWAGDRHLQAGLRLFSAWSIGLGCYSVALLLWYNGFKTFLDWLIVPGETFLVLVALPAVSLLLIIAGLWRKSISLRIENNSEPGERDKTLMWIQGCYLGAPVASFILMALGWQFAFPLTIVLVLPAISAILLVSSWWKRSPVLRKYSSIFFKVPLSYVLLFGFTCLTQSKIVERWLPDVYTNMAVVFLLVPLSMVLMLTIAVKHHLERGAEEERNTNATLNAVSQTPGETVPLSIESDLV